MIEREPCAPTYAAQLCVSSASETLYPCGKTPEASFYSVRHLDTEAQYGRLMDSLFDMAAHQALATFSATPNNVNYTRSIKFG